MFRNWIRQIIRSIRLSESSRKSNHLRGSLPDKHRFGKKQVDKPIQFHENSESKPKRNQIGQRSLNLGEFSFDKLGGCHYT